MRNKNLIGLITVSVLLTMTVLSPTIAAEPSIMITNYEIFPPVFMPGDRGILALTIQNTETQATTTEHYGDATDFVTIVENNGVVINRIWINSDYDDNGNKIKSTAGYNGYEDFGNIAPGASFQVSFELIAEENITEGYYFPDLRIDLKGSQYEDVTFPIEVRVSNETVDLISTNVPSKISESGSTQITFSAVNKRASSVNNIVVTPKTIQGVEFTPESIFIESINGDSSEDLTFSLKPIEKGVKNLSFNISYKNGNNIHTSSVNKTIEIIDTLDVGSVFTGLPKSIKKGGSARITLEVYNAKTEPITGVMVTPISDATILPSQYFIGAMDPDDVFSASFDIFTDDLDYGNSTVDFEVSFKQGNEYYKTPTISSTFYVGKNEGANFQRSESTSSEMQSQPDLLSSCLPVILIIIVVIVVVILWKWKKRRNSS